MSFLFTRILPRPAAAAGVAASQLRCLNVSGAGQISCSSLGMGGLRSVVRGVQQMRPISLLAPTRPTILSSTSTTVSLPPTTATTTAALTTPDLLPRISTHPSLLSQQVRNGPRDTYDPSHRVRKRRAGYLARLRTRTGRAILKRRRGKGRRSLTH